jgi:hypothetical protein
VRALARFGDVFNLLEISACHVLEGNVDTRLCLKRPHKPDHRRVHEKVQYPYLRTSSESNANVRKK